MELNLALPPATKQDAETFAKTYKTSDGVVLLMDDKSLQFAADFANKLVIPAIVQLLVPQIQAAIMAQLNKGEEKKSLITGG